MGKTNLIQTDFLAGELSPRMEMRGDLEGRKHGVEFMENFFLHLQGTAETSRGTEWVKDIVGTSGRVFGFPVNFLTRFMVVLTEGLITIVDESGVVKDNDLMSNGYFDQRNIDWDTTASGGSSALFLQGGVVLSGGYTPTDPVTIRQFNGTIPATVTLEVVIAFGVGPVTIQVGSNVGLSDVLDTVVYGVGTKTFTGLAIGTTLADVRVTLEAGDEDVTISGIHLYDEPVLELSLVSVWPTQSEMASVQAHMNPNATEMILTSASYTPMVLALIGGTWLFAALPLTSAPSEWSALNYPPAGGFFGGRLWLGGVASDPELFWGSKTGTYGDFTLGTLAEDALEQRLTRQGAIRWIAGGPGLLIGTSNAEHIIASDGGVIVPGDIYSKVQSTNGSTPAQALEVGNEVMYVSPDGRKIRSTEYEWTKDAWKSRDLTYASEHITKDNEIVTLLYAANPDSLIRGVTRAGAIVTATYEAYSQTVGFSRRSTQGVIVSAAAVPFAGSDEMWVLVDRGTGVLQVERESIPVNVKLDSFFEFVSATGISGGTALALANKTCQVLVDGAVHPDVIPDGGGVFATEVIGNVIQIGLKVSSVIITLPVSDTAAKVGTTRPMKKRWTELWVRILGSWRPKINGRRPANRRVPTPMGEVEPALTESVEVANTGTDLEGRITIEQDLPLKTEVAGWFGRITQEEI